MPGRGSGTVIGGRVGMKIAPDLVTSLTRGRTVILVSGTNGKTTTTSMVVAGWGGAGTTNENGGKLPPGHVARPGTLRHPRQRHQRKDDDHVDGRGGLGRVGHHE